jgi:diaminohydroxyphosphoribosylaminopyrimidine deaminase/5-amino-6-(5-phosphoribosylamino)uracil reductase
MAGGAAALRAAGLICEPFTPDPEAIEAINRPWLFAMRNRRPFFVLKAAVSLDGRIALPNGESKWITSERARRAAHRLRADLGAVLVGRRTVGLDNPSLTARISGVVNQPTRIVLDPHQRLSEHHAVFDSVAPTLRVVSQAERPGDLPTRSQNGSLDLNELASLLFERGITGVLVEGGAHTHAAFVKAGLVDRIHLFIAPKLLGEGPSWLADFGIRRLEQAPSWQRTGVKTHGPDLEIVLEPAQNLTT